jgi:hypothetical protein
MGRSYLNGITFKPMVETVKKKISSQLTENYFNEEISNPDWAASCSST